MALPPELRLQIYGYVFCNNAPDRTEVPSVATALPPQEQNAKPTPSLHQMDLLKAKDHYPEASLLSTCKLIYHEAEPVFELASKAFWAVDVWTIVLPALASSTARDIKVQELPRIQLIGAKIRSMLLLDKHRLKELRISWGTELLTIITGKAGNILRMHGTSTLPYTRQLYPPFTFAMNVEFRRGAVTSTVARRRFKVAVCSARDGHAKTMLQVLDTLFSERHPSPY